MVVADAIATRRDAETRHALHQAGGEASETAIAERGIGFGAAHSVEIDAEIAERRLDRLGHAEVFHDIGEQPTDQEFERQVVDAFAALGMADAVDREPAVNDPVAQRQRRRDKPVARGRRAAILADRQGQLREDARLEGVDVGFVGRSVGNRRGQRRFDRT